MKPRKSKRPGNISKGAPSGFIISLLIHAAAFLLAGLLVVFTVQQKEEKKFVPPPPADRPKMKLRKPKVQVKKNVKPKATTRIVTKVQRADMPDIQLPEMSGIGEGLGAAVGGFDLLPDLSELSSPFGGSFTTGSDLKGYFYNFNRSRSGRKIPMSTDQMRQAIHDYMKDGWKKTRLSRYYRSPKTLYSSVVCVPTVQSELAPEAFGEEEAEGYCWAVLYEGDLVYPEDITFRFWGVGDKFMGVKVDDDTVLFCAYRSSTREMFGDIWQCRDPKDFVYYFGESRARPSDWITLKAGESRKLSVIMGDIDGGLVYHMLGVEVKDESYPLTRAGGGPTWPVFRTGELSQEVQDVIYANLYPGDLSLTNGPIFRDYVSKGAAVKPAADPEALEEPKADEKMRLWTMLDGKTLEANFRTLLGADVVLQNSKGRQVKLPKEQFSAADQEYLELINPPSFSINWAKSSEQLGNPPAAPWSSGIQRPLQMFSYTFGVRIKQSSTAIRYDHDLKVEYFAVGEEIDGDNYVLLEKRDTSFNPAEYQNKTFSFTGEPVKLTKMAYRSSAPMRGTKYGGYLIMLTDKRGEVVSYKASHEFLYENRDNLRKLGANTHFNRKCERVIPARPTEDSRGSGATDG